MKKKYVTNYLYDGLGFPIELKKVELFELDGEWHPKIDVRKVADVAVKMLVSQKERLTGNQLRFIRKYFSMSLRVFANEVVNESHTAVSKWEKSNDEVTNMDINIEKILRLYVYEKIEMKTLKQKNEFYNIYLKLKNLHASSKQVGHLHIAGHVTACK